MALNVTDMPPPRRATATEFDESVLLADWLTAHRILFCHVPNGGERPKREKTDRRGRTVRFSPEGERLKRMGQQAGAPDYLIFESPPLRPHYKGVAIEMKARAGRPTDEQTRFLEKLEKRGWFPLVAYGGDEAIRWLTELGYARPGRVPMVTP